MLKSLTRSFKLMNKDEFDASLFKATLDDDIENPKEKHITVINIKFLTEKFVLKVVI